MSMPIVRSRRRTRLIATTAAVGLTATTALAAGGLALATPATPESQVERSDFNSGGYVVVLADQPAATYEGGVSGLARTAPADGERLQANSAAVRDYRAHLRQVQQDVADDVGVEPVHQYTVALNGFSASLSAEEAAQLQRAPGVLAVVEDTPRELDTVNTPEFLGLPGDDGVWESLGGPGQAGDGVVVGVIDTGIWPENPSFAGDDLADEPTGEVGEPYRTSDTETAMLKPDGSTFSGECEPGEEWTADLCNDKLISARYFADGFVNNVPPEHYGEHEQISTRDGDGHGTHTAGTAAGNLDVSMTVNDRDFGDGSGVAPGAKVAAYKVCWNDDDETTGGCYPSDSVAAIDQAVLDGVDVLNFSISGATDTVMDPVELAFMSAASANVFVAASAGNSGPGESTVAHNSPWLTSVAASTHVRYEGTVELGDGQMFRGAMIDESGVTEQTPLVYAGDIPAEGVDAEDAALCGPEMLDDEAAADTIVLCDRGVHARADKSAEVARAGGVGSVLANTDPAEGLNADLHTVPTTHLGADDGDAVRDYATSESDPTTTLLPGDQTGGEPTPLPAIAGFSSRGPAAANDGDVLKPDITAPGVDVLAGVAPGPHDDNDFSFLSGTSMSSPHIAGLAALVRGEKPDWSPMAIKSAMMTTAYDPKAADGDDDTNRFNAGAGHVDPTRFLTPGLVYDSGPDDWLSFIEGTGEDLGIPGVEPIDPSNLNQASIAVGDLAGRQVVERQVTAVQPGIYRADIDVPGFEAEVTPSVLHFSRPGETKTFEVTLTRTDAPLEEYAHGTLTWSGGDTTVRSPVVAKPVDVAAPDEVAGTGTSGEIEYDVMPGSSDDIDVTFRGLTPGEVTDGTLTPGAPADPEGNESSQVVEFEVPEGTTTARFDLVAGADDADFDMLVFGPDGEPLPVDGATGASSERVDLTEPEPGTYQVLAHLFSTSEGEAADFSLRNFALGADAAGNADVEPVPISGQVGQSVSMTVSYDGLDEGVPYLGAVGYENSTEPTMVTIE